MDFQEKQKILTEYIPSIEKGKVRANRIFPEANLFIKFKIGNAVLPGESDGKRLGICTKSSYGLSEICLSKTLLSQKHPERDMDKEIVATIVHEYAHVASTIYSYHIDPLGMYLSLLLKNQRVLERQHIERFFEKHKSNNFAVHVSFKRHDDDLPSELISEAYESVYRKDQFSQAAELIMQDYQKIIEKKSIIPIFFFAVLLRMRNLIDIIFKILIFTLIFVLMVSLAFRIFISLMALIL